MRRHTRCALVTVVQRCALPISTGSSAPPLSLSTVAVTSGRSCFATVTTRIPLASVTSTGLGTVTATGVPGVGGITRAAPGAGVTLLISAGEGRGAAYTVAGPHSLSLLWPHAAPSGGSTTLTAERTSNTQV